MHYFITGHTGFKGSWLIPLLKSQGHRVSGYALPPETGSLFELARLTSDLENNWLEDIRDEKKLSDALLSSNPDRIIHLAAQPLVLRSYADPDETFTTNLGGTLNLLSASTRFSSESRPSVLIVTTDKVYKNQDMRAYDEDQPLGGSDPYSSSKVLADLLAQFWIQAFPELRVLIARAGNVIGEYDVTPSRLLPDVVQALSSNRNLIVRNPNHVRPWQHVLDCVAGYVRYMDVAQLNRRVSKVMNFGPSEDADTRVKELIQKVVALKPSLQVHYESHSSQLETSTLKLDVRRSIAELSWSNKIDLNTALRRILEAPKVGVREYVYDSVAHYLKN